MGETTLSPSRACHSADATAIKDLFLEMQERQKRSSNILMFKVPEQSDINEDVNLVTIILGKISISTVLSASNVRRLENRNKDKIRLILITMTCRKDVTQVLKNWRSIPEEFSVSPDYTMKQRENYSRLKAEVEAFNNSNPTSKKVVRYESLTRPHLGAHGDTRR